MGVWVSGCGCVEGCACGCRCGCKCMCRCWVWVLVVGVIIYLAVSRVPKAGMQHEWLHKWRQKWLPSWGPACGQSREIMDLFGYWLLRAYRLFRVPSRGLNEHPLHRLHGPRSQHVSKTPKCQRTAYPTPVLLGEKWQHKPGRLGGRHVGKLVTESIKKEHVSLLDICATPSRVTPLYNIMGMFPKERMIHDHVHAHRWIHS